jgi:hypothetical protein
MVGGGGICYWCAQIYKHRSVWLLLCILFRYSINKEIKKIVVFILFQISCIK